MEATVFNPDSTTAGGLRERLDVAPVICAEGYLFEFERRGYVQAGAFVPEVVLEHPDLVAGLHHEFVHAGSDVVQAFTYYAHREKLRLLGKEHLLEAMNRQALGIAQFTEPENRPTTPPFPPPKTGTLLAGDICNTNLFTGPESVDTVRAMFEEQVAWAVQEGVDFIVGETFAFAEEAVVAAEVIRAAGLPSVITLAIHRSPTTRDGFTPAEACKRIENAGADVVGLNCIRGPRTMLPLIGDIRRSVDCHVAALPVPYRTHEHEPSFQSLTDPLAPDCRPFPTALDPFTCNRYEIADFTREAAELGVRYFGLCCGAGPHHIRAMAEALGRIPQASRFSPDMSKHAYFGTDAKLKDENRAYAKQL
ncbi:MAG: homocysteine S-methyltransferase family protein [Solirubrobacteraceae bacterium]